MRESFKHIVEEITPPILLRGAKAIVASRNTRPVNREEEGEKGPEWYDASFDACDHWQSHYSQSEYYFLWAVIADRIARAKVKSILEIGCGSGQLACLMKDKGIREYHGVDFSPKRIEHAKLACPDYEFSVQDVFKTDLFDTCRYDTVICTEFLEHVEGDIESLERIRPGTRFLGTVPNFPFLSHVRHFMNESEVLSRYQGCFSCLRIDTFLSDAKGKAFYLIEGKIV